MAGKTLSLPLNDLQRRIAPFAPDLEKIIHEVVASGRYILGEQVARFEQQFAHYCGASHAISVASGSDALELSLLACDVAGADIITVANAGGYATNAIFHAGATPVYADIDPDSWLMTPDSLIRAITPSTKAVIVTHLYGLMADMPRICEIASARGIIVIEDCAQAHGAAIGGIKAGVRGAFGCFSFYPTKNLGALGDGGCIVTSNADHAKRLQSLRHYGWGEKYHCTRDIGRNSRMDEIQAAILSFFLPHLDAANDKRRAIIARYRAALSPHLSFQKVENDEGFSGHLCAVRSTKRGHLMQALEEAGIASDIHYPIADYAQSSVVARLGASSGLPETDACVASVFTLPCFPEMTQTEIERVIAALSKAVLE